LNLDRCNRGVYYVNHPKSQFIKVEKKFNFLIFGFDIIIYENTEYKDILYKGRSTNHAHAHFSFMIMNLFKY